MNPCVRAVVRSSLSAGHEVVGIRRGYHGLLNEDFYVNSDGQSLMTLRSVSDLSKLGGTILRSSRSQDFRTEAGQKQGAEVLRKYAIDALIPIGGDGTFHGAVDLAKHWDGQIVGCPGTIDNDLMGNRFHDRLCDRRAHRRGVCRQTPRHGRKPRADVPRRGDGPAQRIYRPLYRPGRGG